MPPETTKPADQTDGLTAQNVVPAEPTNAPVAVPPEPINTPPPETPTAHLEGNEPNSPISVTNSPSNSAWEVMPDPEPVEVPVEAKSPVVEPPTQTPIKTPEPLPEAEHEPPKQPEQPQVVTPPPLQNSLRSFLSKAMAVIQRKKTKKLEKIIAEIIRKKKISNDEVEKLLHVSDATATRYLNQLEKEGKIKQTGKTGRSVF